MEGDLLGLNLTILHIHLIAAQHNWDVFTHPAAHDKMSILQQTGRSLADSQAVSSLRI